MTDSQSFSYEKHGDDGDDDLAVAATIVLSALNDKIKWKRHTVFCY